MGIESLTEATSSTESELK